ncbi:spoIIIJ-associated protein [Carnobacterium iners]|uniref:RNA-binding protein KhpB n=1 Tax=Carnobacterium iners TaxID=1073423 RepID=A0A1X7MU35_9LACT|nr:RNA-binding cell elongation regulator Jag/EloR [Carnobacterium iners]SEK74152.1 spoIIIJ-associated protein [Carnobacterium iners]SMH27463.1 spoIIIJ-associated protein [Carnobacterium iners]
MDKYTAQAATTAEAIQKGLEILGINKENASIEIVTEGKKGIFGFGKKYAIVIVEKRLVDEEKTNEQKKTSTQGYSETLTGDTTIRARKLEEETDESDMSKNQVVQDDDKALQLVSDYLVDISSKMGIETTVTTDVNLSDRQVVFHIHTENAGLMIGKHGRILNALQSLAQVLLYQQAKTKFTVIVNVGDYRERREASLKNVAERTADKVVRTNLPVFLEPMPAFERKQIHFYLSKNKRVTTHSEGNEPHRYLVVEPLK